MHIVKLQLFTALIYKLTLMAATTIVPKISSESPSKVFATSTVSSSTITTRRRNNDVDEGTDPNLVQTTENVGIFSSPTADKGLCNSNANTSEFIAYLRDPYNCKQYSIACYPNSNFKTENFKSISWNPDKIILNQPYKYIQLKCAYGYLYDQIESTCLPWYLVDCSAFQCPVGDILLPDPKRLTHFIQCQNGTAKRHKCEPDHTIYDVGSKICIKPMDAPEPFNLRALRIFISLIRLTADSFSPWVKIVLVNDSISHDQPMTIKNGDGRSSDNNGGLLDGVILKETKLNFEQHAILVFNHDLSCILLYWSALVGTALIFVFSFLLVCFLLSVIFHNRSEKQENAYEDSLDFYRYDQNDSYLMTRM